MTVWDDRILEWISNNDGGTPKQLEDSGYIRVGRSQISRRCRKLADNGLLRPIGNGAYVITEEGEGYLDEEYDADKGVWLNEHGIPEADGPDSSTEEANGA